MVLRAAISQCREKYRSVNHQHDTPPFEWKGFLYWFAASALVLLLFYFVPLLRSAFHHLVAVIALSLIFWLAATIPNLRRLLGRQVLIGLVLGTPLGLSAGLFVAWYSREIPETLLFISPAPYLSQQGFYAEVVDELIHQGRQSGFDVLVWVPDHSFKSEDQRALLEKAVRTKKSYTSVILTPFIKDEHKDEETLFQFIRNMHDSSVFLFDTDLSKGLKQRLSENRPIPACVKGDERAAGRMAANAMVEYFSEKHITNPVVVRLEKGGYSERGIAFMEELERLRPGIARQVSVWPTSEYTRSEAAELARINLRNRPHVDAIFSGNDVSALGVRDVIVQQGLQNIAVFGYDGIFEVRQLLNSGREPIIMHTVDVKIAEQVGYIVWLLSQHIANGKPVIRQPGVACEAKEPRLL